MAGQIRNEARLNFRLPADLKAVIEEAAATLGQSVSDFAISTLVQTARTVLQWKCMRSMRPHEVST